MLCETAIAAGDDGLEDILAKHGVDLRYRQAFERIKPEDLSTCGPRNRAQGAATGNTELHHQSISQTRGAT